MKGWGSRSCGGNAMLGFESPSSWSLIQPRGSWINIWIICHQQALLPAQRQQLHSWRRCEGLRRETAERSASSQRQHRPAPASAEAQGGTPGLPLLAGMEGRQPGWDPGGESRPTLQGTSGQLGFSSVLWGLLTKSLPCCRASVCGERPARPCT